MDKESSAGVRDVKPPSIHVLHPGVDGGGGRNVRTGQYGIVAIHFSGGMEIDSHLARRVTDRDDALEATEQASRWAGSRDGNGLTVVYYIGFARYPVSRLSYDVHVLGQATISEAYNNYAYADEVLEYIGKMPEFFPGRGAK